MFKHLKSIIFSQLVKTLHKVFVLSTEEDEGEQLYDICRAYGLLLNASGIVKNTMQYHDEAAKQVSCSVRLPGTYA